MLIISSPPNDSFTKRLFYKLTHDLESKADIIYLWSNVLEPNFNYSNYDDISKLFGGSQYDAVKLDLWIQRTEMDIRELLKKNINKDIIILGLKDHLTSGFANPHKRPLLTEYIHDMLTFYKDKTFILFTSLENLESYLSNENLLIVPWGGDITNQHIEYKKLDPVINKNFESGKNFIALNRNLRAQRIISLSCIYGLNLQEHGLISFLPKNLVASDSLNFLNLPDYDKKIEKIIQHGYQKLLASEQSIVETEDIYEIGPNNNVGNFKTKLQYYYKNVFVEIINETSWIESSFLLTEKTLNSVYGCNFPIWVTSRGLVSFLRNMGLDVFDDIINHDYDQIDNPVERAFFAIEQNKKLLSDFEYAKNIWIKNQDRFNANIHFVKNEMYEFYEQRAKKQFLEHKEKLNELLK